MDKLRERIESRLTALGISQFEAGKRAGKNSHFIYDFLAGKKREFKGDGLERVAFALQCSPDFLLGNSKELGEPPLNIEGLELHGPDWGLRVAGIVEAGTFRQGGGARVFGERLNIPASPLYPPEAQSAYLVRGSAMDGRGINENMILIALDIREDYSTLKNGSVVIVERARRAGEEVELSARELQHFMDRTEYLAVSNSEKISPIVIRAGAESEDETVKIVGHVLHAILPFN